MNDHLKFSVVNQAMWLRDNCEKYSEEKLEPVIIELAEHGVFSNRNLSKLVKHRISHVKIGKLTNKTSKSGGALAPESLEDIRDVLFSRLRGDIDYDAIARAVRAGTSQNVIHKLSGVSQSTISRRLKNG